MVIRIYEADGRTVTNGAIQLHARILSANEANLMEDSGRKMKVQRDVWRFELHPFEIKTFKLRLRPL
jgi:alpha-mannosidase